MENSNSKKKCPVCGKFVKPDTVYCLWCGETIGEISDEPEVETSVPVSVSNTTPNREFIKSSSLGGNSQKANTTTPTPKTTTLEEKVSSKEEMDIEDDIIDDDISDEEAEYRKLTQSYNQSDIEDDVHSNEDIVDGETDNNEADDDEIDNDETDDDEADDNETDDDEADDDEAFYRALSGQGTEESSRKKIKASSALNSLNKLREQGTETLAQTVSHAKKNPNFEKKSKKNLDSKKQTNLSNTYNPNYDGYYNDICNMIDSKIDSIPKESLIRTIALIIMLLLVIVAMMYYI